MEQAFKKILKKVKLSEPTISTILGAVVIILVGGLIFNYFKSNKGETSQEAATTVEEKQELETDGKIEFIQTEEGKTVPSGLPTTHEIKAEENLWKIAEKYYGSGYNWVDIASENNLTNPDIVTVGQKLNIPAVEVIKPLAMTAGQAILSSQTQDPSIESTSYKVQKGDHLWSIALRAYGDGYKWVEIAKENNIGNPDYIEVDQELKLPR